MPLSLAHGRIDDLVIEDVDWDVTRARPRRSNIRRLRGFREAKRTARCVHHFLICRVEQTWPVDDVFVVLVLLYDSRVELTLLVNHGRSRAREGVSLRFQAYLVAQLVATCLQLLQLLELLHLVQIFLELSCFASFQI